MTVLMLLAAAAILAGVVAVAMGWGGELVPAGPDYPRRAPEIRTPHDVAMLRPPTGLFGYQIRATSDVFWQLAGVLAGRDAEIADLRAQLSALSGDSAGAEHGQSADQVERAGGMNAAAGS